MREIKFRAWDKQYKTMSAVTLIMFNTNEIDCIGNTGEPKDIDHFELMQFTGLKDKNGKEIYEGDILKISTDRFLNFRNKFKVEYNQNESRFEILQYWKSQDKWHHLSNKVSYYQYEVIGNIHDNPELLQQ